MFLHHNITMVNISEDFVGIQLVKIFLDDQFKIKDIVSLKIFLYFEIAKSKDTHS